MEGQPHSQLMLRSTSSATRGHVYVETPVNENVWMNYFPLPGNAQALVDAGARALGREMGTPSAGTTLRTEREEVVEVHECIRELRAQLKKMEKRLEELEYAPPGVGGPKFQEGRGRWNAGRRASH